jgi:tight adherence protein C
MFINVITIASFFAIGMITFLTLRGFARRGGAVGNDAAGRSPAPGPLASAMAGIVPQPAGEIEAIRKELLQAGRYQATALIDYLAIRNSLVVLILIVGGAAAVLAEPGSGLPPLVLAVTAILAVVAYALPRFILLRQAKRRVTQIERSLPDALDLIRMCLTGGLPLRDAMARVSGELRLSHPHLATEFDIIRRQADANSMGKALRNFADRIDTPDVRALSALVSQTERMGTHVASAVAEFADGIRRNYRQRAEERASKTSIALLFPVIFCLMPPILILMAGPPVLRLRNFIIEENAPGGVLNPDISILDAPIDSTPADQSP